MNLIKYKNIRTGETFYSAETPKMKSVDGVMFMEVSRNDKMSSKFFLNESVLERVSDVSVS